MDKKERNRVKQQATKYLNEASEALFSIVDSRDHCILKNLPICPYIFTPLDGETEGSFVFERTSTPESNCGGVYGYSTETTYYFDTTLAALIDAQEALLVLIGGIDNVLNQTYGGNKDVHYLSLRSQLNSSKINIEYEFRNYDERLENYDDEMRRCYQYPIFIEGISDRSEKGYSNTDMKKVFDVLILFRRFELVKYAFNPKHSFFSALKGALIDDKYICGITELKAERILKSAIEVKNAFKDVDAKREKLFSN